MFGGIGITELLALFFIVLLIFGARKLPEIGAGMGKAIRNFKKAASEPEEIDISSGALKEEKQKEESKS